nr:MAG TPA: hypothetical protein [Caudoviricetes sp.]
MATSAFDSENIGLYIEITNANKIFAYFLKVAYLLGPMHLKVWLS